MNKKRKKIGRSLMIDQLSLKQNELDGLKLNVIHLSVTATIARRSEMDDLINTLEIAKLTLPETCSKCGHQIIE